MSVVRTSCEPGHPSGAERCPGPCSSVTPRAAPSSSFTGATWRRQGRAARRRRRGRRAAPQSRSRASQGGRLLCLAAPSRRRCGTTNVVGAARRRERVDVAHGDDVADGREEEAAPRRGVALDLRVGPLHERRRGRVVDVPRGPGPAAPPRTGAARRRRRRAGPSRRRRRPRRRPAGPGP